MPRISGQVCQLEQVPPYVDRQTGAITRSAFYRLHVFELPASIHILRVPEDFDLSLVPPVGSHVDADISMRAYNDRDGKPNIGLTLVAASTPAPSAAGRRTEPAASS